MLDGLGTVLDRLQTLFGKGYLVVGLFPVLLLVLASLPLIALVAPEMPFLLKDVLDLSGLRQALLILCVIVVLSFIGFVLRMANSWFRRMLEGRVALPPSLVKRMTLRHRHRLAAMDADLSAMRPDLVNYRVDVGEHRWDLELREARQRAASNSGVNATVSAPLLRDLVELQQLADVGQPIPHASMEAVFRLLKADLAAKKAEELAALGQVHNRFRELAKYAHEDIEARFGRMRDERYRQYPQEASRVAPTILANLSLAHEDHIYARYSINIDLLWPAVARIVRGDAQFSTALDEAQLRLEFSVSMAAVSMIYTLMWSIVLLIERTGSVAFATIAVAGPILAIVFYQMTIWNLYSFCASVRSAVELFRFDVLKSLHLQLPSSAKYERELWKAVTVLEELGQGNIFYHHS